MLNSGMLRNSFKVAMICLDLEQIRDWWKMNADRELDRDNGSAQTSHGGEAGDTFQHLTILSDATKQAALQVSLHFKAGLMKLGLINKFWEAHLCHKQLISFAEPISPVFLKSDRGTETGTEQPRTTASACLLLYTSVWAEMPCEK